MIILRSKIRLRIIHFPIICLPINRATVTHRRKLTGVASPIAAVIHQHRANCLLIPEGAGGIVNQVTVRHDLRGHQIAALVVESAGFGQYFSIFRSVYVLRRLRSCRDQLTIAELIIYFLVGI